MTVIFPIKVRFCQHANVVGIEEDVLVSSSCWMLSYFPTTLSMRGDTSCVCWLRVISCHYYRAYRRLSMVWVGTLSFCLVSLGQWNGNETDGVAVGGGWGWRISSSYLLSSLYLEIRTEVSYYLQCEGREGRQADDVQTTPRLCIVYRNIIMTTATTTTYHH